MKISTYLIFAAILASTVGSLMADRELDRLETLHRNLDLNQDGGVPNQEFLDFWEARFSRLDRDDDVDRFSVMGQILSFKIVIDLS